MCLRSSVILLSSKENMLIVALAILNFVSSGGTFVQELNEFHKFDYNILIFNDGIEMLIEGIFDSNVPKNILLLNSDNDHINQQSEQRIALTNGKNCLLLAFTNMRQSMEESSSLIDAILPVIKKLSYWNVKIKIGIVTTTTIGFSDEERLKLLKKIFDWSWSNLIVNIFVLYLENDQKLVYTYNRYNSNEVKQVEPIAWSMYFQNKGSNIYGHQLHISFVYEDAAIRFINNRFESRDGKMCEYIMNGLNSTYRVTYLENVTWGLNEELIYNGSVDFTPRLFNLVNMPNPERRIYTYPVRIDSTVLLVPAAKLYNQFQSFFKNFAADFSIILIIVPIILIIIIFWIVRLVKSEKSELLQSVVDVISLLFTLDITGRNRYSESSDRLFILSLSFGGLFFTNEVLSVFISIVTQPAMKAEINTFGQFDKTSFKIAVPDPNFTFYLVKLSALKGLNWTNRIEEEYKLEKFMYQMYSYNTTLAYFITRSRTDVLIERQKHLSLRGYHIPDEYFELTLTAYFIGSRAPFKDKVDQLILQAFSAGLYDKWNRDTYPNLIKVGYFEKFDVIGEEPEESINITLLPMYGWFLSVVLFVFEICYFYFKKHVERVRHSDYASQNSD